MIYGSTSSVVVVQQCDNNVLKIYLVHHNHFLLCEILLWAACGEYTARNASAGDDLSVSKVAARLFFVVATIAGSLVV